MAKKKKAEPAAVVLNAPASTASKLTVVDLPIGTVKPYPGNPRHNEAAIGKAALSITQYGWRQPIVVDEAMVILAGHTRLYAARQLGLTHVPVHVATGLSPALARAYRLADNRTAQEAAWDPDALKVELLGLKDAGLALEITGFDDLELDTLLGIPDGFGMRSFDPEDVPDPPAVPTSKLGNVYQCGVHRVLCGDATRAQDWALLLGDDRADLLFTDPPYDVKYEGKTKAKLTIKNDALGHEGTVRLLRASLGLALGYLRDGGSMYVCAPHGPQFYAFAKVGTELGWWRQTFLWVKDQFALGRSDMHYKHEAILEGVKIPVLIDAPKPKGATAFGYGWNRKGKHAWLGDRTEDTVWEYARPRRNAEHPTMKPLELVERALRNSSAVGAVVVDCFAGSGTTLLASEATGRRALVMELDPAYVDVIVARWEKATGQRAALMGAPVPAQPVEAPGGTA